MAMYNSFHHVMDEIDNIDVTDGVPIPSKYQNAAERHKTFADMSWNVQLDATPDKLVKAGFVYIAEDIVKCAYCYKVFTHWQPGDSAIERHINISNNICSFVKNIEEQTAVLEKHIRSKEKKTGLVSAAELMAAKDNERQKTRTSTARQIHRKTLQTMKYDTKMINEAERNLDYRNNPALTLESLLQEVRRMEEEQFWNKADNMGVPDNHSTIEDNIPSSDEEHADDCDIIPIKNLDERVVKVQNEGNVC